MLRRLTDIDALKQYIQNDYANSVPETIQIACSLKSEEGTALYSLDGATWLPLDGLEIVSAVHVSNVRHKSSGELHPLFEITINAASSPIGKLLSAIMANLGKPRKPKSAGASHDCSCGTNASGRGDWCSGCNVDYSCHRTCTRPDGSQYYIIDCVCGDECC